MRFSVLILAVCCGCRWCGEDFHEGVTYDHVISDPMKCQFTKHTDSAGGVSRRAGDVDQPIFRKGSI